MRTSNPILWFLCCLWLPGHAATLNGQVVGVADGDTVTVIDQGNIQHKIRLAGIDAPEKNQPFGSSSKWSLSSLTYGREVTIQYEKKDRYGRIVGKIVGTDGTDINLEQVKRGLAWHYKQYEREQSLEDRVKYAEAEDAARRERKGLWSQSDPVPPWEYRAARRTN